MMFHPVIIFFLIFFEPNLIFTPLEDDEWEKSMDKDDIVIYTRKMEGSPFKEFIAETEMRGSFENFRHIITNIDNYHKWLPNCKSAVVIENPAENDITYHMKLKVPFPFSKRDMIQQIILTESKDKLMVDIINRPQKVAEEKNYVRMLKADGKWIIKKISKNEVAIKFRYAADPGGGVPAWLVNTFIVDDPHKTLKNLRKMMASE